MKKENRKYLVLILVGLLSFLALFLYLIDVLTAKEPFTFGNFIKSIAISFPFMVLIAWVDYKLVLLINRSEWLCKHLIARILFEGCVLSILAAFFVIIGNIPFK